MTWPSSMTWDTLNSKCMCNVTVCSHKTGTFSRLLSHVEHITAHNYSGLEQLFVRIGRFLFVSQPIRLNPLDSLPKWTGNEWDRWAALLTRSHVTSWLKNKSLQFLNTDQCMNLLSASNPPEGRFSFSSFSARRTLSWTSTQNSKWLMENANNKEYCTQTGRRDLWTDFWSFLIVTRPP